MKCTNCEGDGYIDATCPSCSGSGEGSADRTTCRTCKGQGEKEVECEECEGDGEMLSPCCGADIIHHDMCADCMEHCV